jgi:NDP-sugar pyrophosphorylase family protein
MSTLILCGGRGERLIPLTDTIPKPLLPVQGVPFLDTLTAQLRGFTIQDPILCCGYRGQQILSHFGSKYKFSLIETEPLINTAARICKALPNMEGAKYLMVFNGDSLCTITSDWFWKAFGLYKESGSGICKLLVCGEGSLLSSRINPVLVEEEPFYGAGIYFMEKKFVESWGYNDDLSLERDVIPKSDCFYLPLPKLFCVLDFGTHENYGIINNKESYFGKVYEDYMKRR